MEKCKWCDGEGRVRIEIESGKFYDEECAACHGKGKVEKQPDLDEIYYR